MPVRQHIVLGGLPWTIESEEPLPSKFDVFVDDRVRSPERGGHSPAQGEALGEGATQGREETVPDTGNRGRLPMPPPSNLHRREPLLRVLPDPSLVGEPAPWDPTITHEDGIIRYRGQEVAAEGRLPLDEFDVRAAPHSLGAERALLGWMVTRMTYRGEGLFLHAASIRGNGGAWLLVGGPGVGKSTACRLLGDRSLCTNVTCLREENGRWMAYPTAFTGQPDPPPQERGPFAVLGAIVLRKSDTVGTLEPVSGTARMAWLAKAIVAHYPSIPECTHHVVGALASLAAGCAVYTLAFRRDAISMPD